MNVMDVMNQLMIMRFAQVNGCYDRGWGEIFNADNVILSSSSPPPPLPFHPSLPLQNGNFACLKKCGIQIEGKLSSREEACMSRCLGMYVKTAEVVSTVIAEKSQRGGM
jgi:hypothetical protein